MTTHAELALHPEALGSSTQSALFDEPAGARLLLSDKSRVRLLTGLQSTLDLEEMLKVFVQEARRIVRRFSFCYLHEEMSLSFAEGRGQQHRCTYELDLHGRTLGVVVFSRAHPFTEDEQRLMEVMLCCLVYPLRNVLLYQTAMQSATVDPLTRVQNRRALDGFLGKQVAQAIRQDVPLSMMMVDIDLFKAINDTWGHVTGDHVLAATAETLVDCARGSDCVFRYGGEEFAILLANTSPEGAMQLANRIRQAISENRIEVDGEHLGVTVSIGVATLKAGESADELVNRADRHLYRAKLGGRNRVETD